MAWQRSALRRKSITYADSAEPQKRRLVASVAPLAYADAAGEYLPIDMTPQRINNAQFNGWRIVNNGWHYGLETSGQVWFGGRRGEHVFKFRLSRIGYTQVDQGAKPDFASDFTDIGGSPTYNTANLSFTPNAITLPDGDANIGALAEWRDLWPALPQGEINVRWALNGDRLKEEVVISQAAREWIAANRAPGYYGLTPSQTWLTFAFQVDWSDIPKRYRDGIDLSASQDFSDTGGVIEGRNALDELLFFMPLDDAYVDETIDTGRTGTDGNPITETRRTKTALRKRFWRNDADGQWWLVVGTKVSDLAALPAGDLVFDPTLTSDVAAGSDDAYWRFGYMDSEEEMTVGMAEPGIGSNAGQGYRFDGITLTGSDTVDSVYITLVSTVNQWAPMDNRWTFENSDDAATFSSGSIPGSRSIVSTIIADASNFSHTAGTAYNYPYASGDQDSLAAALQEVIDRAGWASGNAVALINQTAQDASVQYGYARISHATYDHATYAAPQLVVDYTAGGPAAQTINANAISSGATVYAPAITPGAVTIALDAVSSGATVYAPAITPGAVEIALDAIGSGAAVYEPSVTVGAATITPDAISSAAAVYEPAITTGPVTVALNAIDSTAQVYEPAVTPGAVTISTDAISSTAQVYEPTVTPGTVTIAADSISSTAQVYEPAISTGALLIQPNRIESTAEVYAPAISGGAVVIAPDRIESGAQVFEPAITPGAVTVAPDFVTSSAAVYAPGIGYVIRPDIIDSAAAVYAPAVTTGATTIAAAFIASAAQVYAPTITGGVPAVIGGILITLPADYTSISVPTDYTSITIPADSGRSS